jgi:hypothetical protein
LKSVLIWQVLSVYYYLPNLCFLFYNCPHAKTCVLKIRWQFAYVCGPFILMPCGLVECYQCFEKHAVFIFRAEDEYAMSYQKTVILIFITVRVLLHYPSLMGFILL